MCVCVFRWVISGYYKVDSNGKPTNNYKEMIAVDENNWFRTGDVCSIDPDGYIQITDRNKDVIKSGGEWISSIELENLAVSHPSIAEAAVIGIEHPKWQERPLVIAVLKEGKTIEPIELINYMSKKLAKWQLPSDIVFVKELPHTATGKLLKTALRKQFKDYKLSEEAERRIENSLKQMKSKL